MFIRNKIMKELILLTHIASASIGILATIWVIAETLNARAENLFRIRAVSIIAVVAMFSAWIFGGYWYVNYYPVDKAILLAGNHKFAHEILMETKEHLFFVVMILVIYLHLIALKNNLADNKSARKLIYVVGALVLATAFIMGELGGSVALGVKGSLLEKLPAQTLDKNEKR